MFFFGVATADGKDEDHVGLDQARSTEPICVACVPALIVHSRGKLGDVVRWCIRFDLRDLAKIADRVGGMPCTAADTKEKEPARTLAQVEEQIRGAFDS